MVSPVSNAASAPPSPRLNAPISAENARALAKAKSDTEAAAGNLDRLKELVVEAEAQAADLGLPEPVRAYWKLRVSKICLAIHNLNPFFTTKLTNANRMVDSILDAVKLGSTESGIVVDVSRTLLTLLNNEANRKQLEKFTKANVVRDANHMVSALLPQFRSDGLAQVVRRELATKLGNANAAADSQRLLAAIDQAEKTAAEALLKHDEEVAHTVKPTT